MGAKCLKCIKDAYVVAGHIRDFIKDAAREATKEELKLDLRLIEDNISLMEKDGCLPAPYRDQLWSMLSGIRRWLEIGELKEARTDMVAMNQLMLSFLEAVSKLCQRGE